MTLGNLVSRGLVGLAALGVLTACSDGNGTAVAGGGGKDDEMQARLDELAGSGSRLTLSGAVTSTGEYTTAEDPRYGGVSNDIFRPAQGGGASRRGSNADGPYALSIYTDATHEDEPDNVVRAWVSLVLPEGAEAGNHYQVASFSDADDDQVQAHVQGDGMAWSFSHQVSGSVYLEALGEQVSAAWQFEAADGRGEAARGIQSEGAVKDLPLTRQAEAEYDMTVNGESEPTLSRITGRSNMLIIGNGIYLYLPSGATEGSYPIQSDRDDAAVRAQFTQHEVDEITGELTLSANGERYDAEFSIDARGEDELELAGLLRWFTLDDE
ncbi:hypothetical protein [Halomonas campaniensis]|uniref:hypothetical protein n=1 Tax=Halomonas campaniensis TaxID=213554 RepID=UPI00356907C4